MNELWFGYVWPSLKGNGPEDLIHVAVFAILAAVIYPPLRRWIEREADHLHMKLDHIIKHSDMPDLPAHLTGRSWSKNKEKQ